MPNRKYSDGRETDESSRCYSDEDTSELVRHVRARFGRFIRLSAITQRISEDVRYPRNRLIRGGRSLNQDTSGSRDIHAAHIIQAQLVPGIVESIGRRNYEELRRFVQHTQPQRAYHNNSRLGRAIDNAQRDAINNGILNLIDFSLGPSNSHNISTVRTILNIYLDLIRAARERELMGQRRQGRLDDLSVAIGTLQHMDIRDVLARAYGYYRPTTNQPIGHANFNNNDADDEDFDKDTGSGRSRHVKSPTLRSLPAESTTDYSSLALSIGGLVLCAVGRIFGVPVPTKLI